MNSFIETLNQYFGIKAPALPMSIKEIIVKYGPYLLIIGLIFSILAILALIPFILAGGVVMGAAGVAAAGSMSHVYISLIFGIITAVMEIVALPGLFKRTPGSWKLLFYAQLVSLLAMLVGLNIIGLIISAIVGFYILFQIKPLYNGVIPMSSAPSSGMPPTPPQTPSQTPPTQA